MISYHPRKCDYNKWEYAEGYQPLATKDYGHLSVVMRKFVWSPIIYVGGHRKAENFIEAHFLGLDFDKGLRLSQAVENIFCDMSCIIGTTRHHQLEKIDHTTKKKVICDRFRILIELEEPIRSAEHYKQKVKSYVDRYGCDVQACDGARFFWPCKNIVFSNHEGFKEEIGDPPKQVDEKDKWTMEQQREWAQKNYRLRGLTGWLKKFLEKGVIPEKFGGRNTACNQAARELLCIGYDPVEIKRILVRAPFVKEGFLDREYDTTIDSAANYIRDQLAKEDANGPRQGR